MDDVITYSVGVVSASVCALSTVERAEVERQVNARHPTGVGPWQITSEPFRTGEPNPCPCNHFPHTRIHYLLHC